MNTLILTEAVQAYLQAHADQSPSALALAKSPFPDVPSSVLAAQLDGMQRSKRKLPLWHHTPGIYYPSKLSVEQSSSEATARYKAQLLDENQRIIDVTGGFGVDSYFFSTRAQHVTYVERDPELAKIVSHNMRVLGAENNVTCLSGDGISHLLDRPDGTFDTAYVDPSRRVAGKKVFRLGDCEPDIEALHTALLTKTRCVLVKAAPLLDISASLEQLTQVNTVYILSINNECKEILFLLQRGFRGTPTLVASMLNPAGEVRQQFHFQPEEEREARAILGTPARYLYEPDAAVMKSGAYKLVGIRYGLQKLHTNTHLYTSEAPIPVFPGRAFRIDKTVPYAQFKKDKSPHAGNVSARNFPLRPDELRRKHRIGEDTSRFLFFCTEASGQLIVIFASK